MKLFINKRLGLILFCSSIFYLACRREALDILPNNPTEDTYFRNEAEFTAGIFGIYAKQSDFYWYNGSQNGSTLPIFILPGDDITISDQDEFEQFGQIQPASGRLNYLFRRIYQMISRANIMLQKIGEEQGVYTTANLKNYHRGEALFLRGLAYYYLWNIFGTAPLLPERVLRTDQLTPPGTNGTELLDQAIKDFTEAATLLPLQWDVADRGRATANSANGMLGKSLVFKGSVSKSQADYASAIVAFDKITGVQLTAAFDDNFAADTENNEESLFEYQATAPFGDDNVWLDNDFDRPIGSMSVFWGFYDNNFALFGKSRFFATDKLLNAFDAGDPRRELTLNPANKNFRKYVGTRGRLTQSGVGSANNVRILRYADVLLLKAEAIVKSGGSATQAINLINTVRQRARNMQAGGSFPVNRPTSETSIPVIMQWIITERLLELSGEGQRWFDLRRWHLSGDITLNNAYFSSATASMAFDAAKHLYFPIPSGELDINPNVTQNPGY